MTVTVAGSAHLTEEEWQVLELLGTGMTNREIARQMSISSRTVKVDVKNLVDKLQIGGRAEAALYASFTGNEF